MGFKEKSFDKPIYEEQLEEPSKLFIISCEGRNTEPEYFELLNTTFADYIDDIVNVEIVPKEDNPSEPKHVINNLEEHIENKYGFSKETDNLWIVIDREKCPQRKIAILEKLDYCKDNKINIALSNPSFEFWLLLHVTDINTLCKTKLYENEKVSKKKTYCESVLSSILQQNTDGIGFKKKKNQFNKNIITEENLKRALVQEKSFEQELVHIIDKLGCNMGSLITSFIKLS